VDLSVERRWDAKMLDERAGGGASSTSEEPGGDYRLGGKRACAGDTVPAAKGDGLAIDRVVAVAVNLVITPVSRGIRGFLLGL